MRKTLFQILAGINRVLVPRMSRHDLTKLTKLQKGIVAYRYWVTKNSL